VEKSTWNLHNIVCILRELLKETDRGNHSSEGDQGRNRRVHCLSVSRSREAMVAELNVV